MKYPRFRVATCEGYAIHLPVSARGYGQREPGLSATVCDTLHGWREVQTYRSEDRGWFHGRLGVRGVVAARADAEDHAAYLNAIHRRELHAERVRGYREEARANG